MEIYSYSIILIAVILCEEIQTQQCVKKKCESKNGRYKSCKINSVPDDNFITSVTVEDEKGSNESNEGCTFNVTYGYTTNTIWVNKGCRADFIACYSRATTLSSPASSTETDEFSTESSSPTKITTLPGMTTKHANQSTSRPMKMGSNKNTAGLVGGIIAGVGFVAVALLVLTFILKRFSLYCFARKVPYENKNDEENYTGNQNEAYTNSNASNIQGNNKNYTTLGNERDTHYYKETRNSPQRESEYYNIEPPQSQIEYHTNEPHSYMTVYDSLDQNKQSSLTNATYEEVQQKEKGSTKILGKNGDKHYDYAEFASSITNSQDSTNSNISSEPHEYFILDPKEITYENHKYHSSGKESYSSQTKDYFVLDPKETGFDRSTIKNLDNS
ncbi:uncharacterized protein LOC134725195 isoform X1 [Mytilus trossulus]|uniref:uncharacterized protein LOC134725195 isoform X1 n=1 Tax=Mytilus trossulus TaxID=6551 RepID=UPI00300629DE